MLRQNILSSSLLRWTILSALFGLTLDNGVFPLSFFMMERSSLYPSAFRVQFNVEYRESRLMLRRSTIAVWKISTTGGRTFPHPLDCFRCCRAQMNLRIWGVPFEKECAQFPSPHKHSFFCDLCVCLRFLLSSKDTARLLKIAEVSEEDSSGAL